MGTEPPGRITEGEKVALMGKGGRLLGFVSMKEFGPSVCLFQSGGNVSVDVSTTGDGPHVDFGDTSRGWSAGLIFRSDRVELYFLEIDRGIETSLTIRPEATGVALYDTKERHLCSVRGEKV